MGLLSQHLYNCTCNLINSHKLPIQELADPETVDTNYKTHLARAITIVLRPLINLLIRQEFTHAELTELVRQAYVDVAYKSFSIPNQEMTVSRVAVLTGLSRKEVVRLRDSAKDSDAPAKLSPNRAQRVVQGWMNDTEFLNSKNRPRILPIKNVVDGQEQGSFVALCRRYSGDITYGAVLDELNRVEITTQPNENTVKLVNTAYVPKKDELEQVRIVATCVSDLFNTTLHNIDAEKDQQRFQRQVVYSGVDEAVAEIFRQMVAEKSTRLIEELNVFLAQNRKNTKKKQHQNTTKRVGFGVYHIDEIETKRSKN